MLNQSGTTFTTAVLIADTYQPDLGSVADNGSVDSIPGFTKDDNDVQVSAALEIQSTLGALLLPRMTTAEKDDLTPADGMLLYDTTLDALQVRESDAWAGIPSVSGATVINDIPVFSDTAGAMIDSGVKLLYVTNNLFEGIATGKVNTSGAENSAFGINVLTLVGGSRNTGFGNGIFSILSGGDDNIGCGVNILNGNNALSNRNVLIGNSILSQIDAATITNDNTAFGDDCFSSATLCNDSVAFGSGAGSTQSAYTQCGFFGTDADASVNGLTNAYAIGANARVAVNNAIVLGAAGMFIGINTASPTCNLHANGSVGLNTVVVNTPDFPYTVTDTDYLLVCYPSGVISNLYLPDAVDGNLGRAIRVSNSSASASTIEVHTVGMQPVFNNAMTIREAITYVAMLIDGVYQWQGCF